MLCRVSTRTVTPDPVRETSGVRRSSAHALLSLTSGTGARLGALVSGSAGRVVPFADERGRLRGEQHEQEPGDQPDCPVDPCG